MANEHKHTPGPWIAYGAKQRNGDRIISTEGGQDVAYAADFNRYDYDETVNANARLIAAAPELLGAASNALAMLNMQAMRYANLPKEDGRVVEIEAMRVPLRAAIAKAMEAR